MDNLCKKFPKICNCPYKEDIDNQLQQGKTPYAISKWLSKTECPISESTLKRYRTYLTERGMLSNNPTPIDHNTELNKESIDAILRPKLFEAIQTLDLTRCSPNVTTQFIIGVYKLLYGEAEAAPPVDPELSSLASDERTIEILNERANNRS